MLRAILGDPSNTPAAQVRLMLLVMLTSAFVDDAALVALLVPLVTRWAAQHGFPPGQLLLPLSYAALLGGNLTLVGNPVNLLLAGMMIWWLCVMCRGVYNGREYNGCVACTRYLTLIYTTPPPPHIPHTTTRSCQ